MVDDDTLRGLLREAQPALSLYFPLAPQQRDERGPEARLRALLDRAAGALQQSGAAPAARDAMLAPARDIAGTAAFAHQHDHGFVLFADATGTQMLRLPGPEPELLVVGRHFHLKPLLPAIARNRRFSVLALSAGDARLYSATPFAWRELKLDELPPRVEAEARDRESAEASPRRADAVLTTASDPDALRHELLTEDMRRVAYAVRRALGDDPAPLLLAAEPPVASHFRAVAHLPQLQEAGLALNPFALPERELQARAAELMRPAQDAAAEAVLEQVRARLGSADSLVGIRPEEILTAARDGRVEAVVVALDEGLWGRFDPPKLVVHGHQTGAEPDLLNEAAVTTLLTGGRAYAVPIEHLPRRSPCVATYRF